MNAFQIRSSAGLWISLYAFSFQLFLDFSGYTDIAIGIGQLMGIHLPENFDRPYLQPNLAAFWRRWHITLTDWFRSYLFNPLVRFMRGSQAGVPVWLIILLGQLVTMVSIGLWHGIQSNFVLWGLWHALGLYAHNRWQAILRLSGLKHHAWLNQRIPRLAGSLLTFHFVTLGWVWFALDEPSQGLAVLGRLFGG
jgi:alginate O-acetyltransferase complex protein AlgI